MLIRKLAAVLLAVSLGVWAAGCSGNANDSTTDDTGTLREPYGGYTSSDESPAFGDPELASAMGAEPGFEDVLYGANALDSLEKPGRTIYALSVRWGQLEGDSSSTTPTDWTGSMELIRGGIVVRQIVRFEPGDHIVRPRTARTLLEWVSHTTVHFDGLLVLIHDPIVDPDSAPAPPPNQLVFTTPLYSRTFSMSELESLEEIVDVDAAGNQIAFNARRLDLTQCGEGPLEGIWRLNPSHRNGEFFGRWMTEDGVFHGHLRGHFGARPDGNKVFFGKVIGVDGHFQGLLRGTWGFDDTDSTMGWFEGAWASRAGVAVGTVGGHWQSKSGDVDADDDDHGGPGGGNGHGRGHGRGPRWGGGYFSGWWERACDSDSAGGA